MSPVRSRSPAPAFHFPRSLDSPFPLLSRPTTCSASLPGCKRRDQLIERWKGKVDRAHGRAARAERASEIYLAAAAEEDAAFCWIIPIPRPPIAPASRPSTMSTGILSKRDFLMADMTPPLVLRLE